MGFQIGEHCDVQMLSGVRREGFAVLKANGKKLKEEATLTKPHERSHTKDANY